MAKKFPDVDDAMRHTAEVEIKTKQNDVKYDLRDFTVDYLISQFHDDFFYVPPYQRKFIWKPSDRCRFIESVLLGLPIPMMFVADMDDGRLEIVDGAQRIRTLESFKNDDLTLEKLKRLPSLNGFRFSDLPLSQRRKFGTKAMRIVVLDDSTSPETRQEIFDRVNTSGMPAKPSEIRRGAHPGPFMSFVAECASEELFAEVCPISESLRKRYEHEELVLRFFAYSEDYLHFQHDVEPFLTRFVKENSESFDRERLKAEFTNTLKFVQKHFPYGFAKGPKSTSTPRVRFEAISVGVNLALRERPDLTPSNPREWLESEEFERLTTTHASNSLPRLRNRIEFVRDHLLNTEG